MKGRPRTARPAPDTDDVSGTGERPWLDVATLVDGASTSDLLRLYAAILTTLRRRNVVRSANAPAGDLAEFLAVIVYDGELAPPSAKSWDVRADDGRLVQVKSRVVRAGQAGNYSFFRSYAFDVCVFVVFDAASYDVSAAIEVPAGVVESRASASAHVNGSRVALSERLADLSGAIDRTAEFRRAFETLRLPPV